MEDLHLKLDPVNGNATITVLQGDALEQKAPNVVKLSGDINTVNNFLSVRKETSKTNISGNQFVDLSKAVVQVDKKALTITLLLDPENYYGTVVTGKLESSEEIKQFFINKDHTFTKEQLVKLIKFSKLYFDDADKHAAMLLAFQKVSSTVNIQANDSSDTRGNKERGFIKEVTTNAPTEFILNIPIWKGFPPVRFRVEIGLDVTEGSARFWFESTELYELMQSQVDEIFTEALKESQGLVIINN